jgi:hypothetical protein
MEVMGEDEQPNAKPSQSLLSKPVKRAIHIFRMPSQRAIFSFARWVQGTSSSPCPPASPSCLDSNSV